MARVRSVLPTDLVALASHGGRIRPNEAVTRERAGTQASARPLETAIEQWFSFARGRHTWISVKGMALRGLASARRRGAKTAWELDCLIHTDEDESVLMSLLDRVVEDAGRAGAEKIFLRVPVASDVVRTAVATGFFHYLTEWLMAAEGPHRATGGDPLPALRRWTRADAYATFRLYNRWTPAPVRRIEAPTFREWIASRERISPNRGARQWLIERDGDAHGWLRVAADGETGRFELMTDVAAAPELTDALIDSALARLSEQSALLTLVPEFAAGLRERLEARGFEERDSFVVLARRTTRPVAAAELAPAVPVPTVPA
jgi:hypothetical protein